MKRSDAGFRQSCHTKRFPGSAKARLSFRVLERLKRVSLVEVQLDTGFKNQIRAQFAAIGHPLVGEQQYTRKDPRFGKFDHQALHAWKLSFTHPSNKRTVHFMASLPGDLAALLKREGSSLGLIRRIAQE
jgi:23S rRNA-/tRNA-specific pseudouridylate synthase